MDLEGKTWTLSSLKGQTVVLNFWASWCEPCRAEMPSLELLARKYAHEGLVVLAVNYQEATPTIERFLAAVPFALPILLDRDGQAARAWTPRVFPSTVLIDRAGRPRHVVLGELDWVGDVALGLIKPLLARDTAGRAQISVYADNSRLHRVEWRRACRS
jgi:thiol-disulfide isomerase/thioredoxin